MTEGPGRSCGFRHGLGVVCRPDLPCDPVERDRVVGARIALMGKVSAAARPAAPTRPPARPRPAPRPPRRRLWAARVLALLVFVVTLAGCSETAKDGPADGNLRVVKVESPDGRTVFCALFNDRDTTGQGTLDCDWLNAR